jgi:hypothetical protein
MADFAMLGAERKLASPSSPLQLEMVIEGSFDTEFFDIGDGCDFVGGRAVEVSVICAGSAAWGALLDASFTPSPSEMIPATAIKVNRFIIFSL